jgi:hypothetical protein
LAKDSLGVTPYFPARRPIAIVTIPDPKNAAQLHLTNIPTGHRFMFFRRLVGSEMAGHVPGGDFGYTNMEDDAENVGQLYSGKPFVWPEELMMPVESTAPR